MAGRDRSAGCAVIRDDTGKAPAPVCPNLIVHRSNARLDAGSRTCCCVTSRRSSSPRSVRPRRCSAPLHDAGALVFADVASIRHAERAVAAGADGLVLLTAGAGGQTGWLNPFVFVRAVRAFFDGPIVLAGGISDGHALRAAEALGCDLAYMGTKFIATRESMADPQLQGHAGDEQRRRHPADHAPSPACRPTCCGPRSSAAGLDPDDLPAARRHRYRQGHRRRRARKQPKRWRDIWSAGHSTSGVTEVLPVDELVARTLAEYRAANPRLR